MNGGEWPVNSEGQRRTDHSALGLTEVVPTHHNRIEPPPPAVRAHSPSINRLVPPIRQVPGRSRGASKASPSRSYAPNSVLALAQPRSIQSNGPGGDGGSSTSQSSNGINGSGAVAGLNAHLTTPAPALIRTEAPSHGNGVRSCLAHT